LVVVARVTFVVVSVTTTVAPGTTAPDWSVIEPAIVPVDVDCAHMGRALPTQITNRRNRANFTLREFIIFLRYGNSSCCDHVYTFSSPRPTCIGRPDRATK
jgi:hypothetical protein